MLIWLWSLLDLAAVAAVRVVERETVGVDSGRRRSWTLSFLMVAVEAVGVDRGRYGVV